MLLCCYYAALTVCWGVLYCTIHSYITLMINALNVYETIASELLDTLTGFHYV